MGVNGKETGRFHLFVISDETMEKRLRGWCGKKKNNVIDANSSVCNLRNIKPRHWLSKQDI